MVGIPTYGKRFTLYSKYLNYPGSLAVSSKGDNSYSEVCDFLNLNNTVQVKCLPSHLLLTVPNEHYRFPLTESGPARQSGLRLQWLRLDQLRGREQCQGESTLDTTESLWRGNALQLECRRFSLSVSQRHSISTASNCARCTSGQLKALLVQSFTISFGPQHYSNILSHSHCPFPAIKSQLATALKFKVNNESEYS